MDDIAVRSKYPRYNVSAAKRNRNSKAPDAFLEHLVRQIIICIILFIIVGAIKGIDSPMTNFLTGKIKSVLFLDIELKSIYKGIDSLYVKLKNTNLLSGQKSTFIAPVNGTLSSAFGKRINPIDKTEEFHEGVDIKADYGAPIKAVCDGTVIETGSEPSYGKYLKISHPDGITTVYAHCSQLIAQKGQDIKQGSVIAKVGDTGASTGTHLHFEIWENGTSLDPLQFIKAPLE